jgi:hypothetical protein
MTKEFIPFELAYQLKELEFDEECLGFYDAYNGDSHLFLHDRYKPLWLVRTWRRLFSKSVSETTFVSQSYVEYIDGVCLAPTFSQAFRFFREKYELFVQPNRTVDSYGIWYYFSIEPRRSGVCEGSFIYEEAELECLRKLIQIVKQQQ